MTERIYFHIGAPKTGTTYLQNVLLHNRELLMQHGILYVGERWNDHVHANLAVRQHPRLETLDEEARSAWDRLVAEALEFPGHTAILSHEFFGAATTEQAKQAIADLEPAEVHLVFTARDFAGQLRATWQEQLKYRQTLPLSQWWPNEGVGSSIDWGWHTLDPAAVLSRWSVHVPTDHVHVVTLPRPGSGQDELWRRFAAVCQIEASLVELNVAKSNESLGVVEAELLRRVNEKIEPPITGAKEASRWIREVMAKQILAPRGGDRFELTPEQLERLTPRTAETIEYLRNSGFDISGDLDDLRAQPSRPNAPTPEQVTDRELLEAGISSMAAMLHSIRDRTIARDTARQRVSTLRVQLRNSREKNQAAQQRLATAQAKLRDTRSQLESTQAELVQARAALRRSERSSLVPLARAAARRGRRFSRGIVAKASKVAGRGA